MTENSWDVIIAGGGAAGLSAALMLGRSRRRVLVIDAGSPRNRNASHMHGVLGLEGIPPAELLARGRAEVEGYGVELAQGTVEGVERERGGLRVATSDGAALTARALVVATGLTDELPDVPGLAERWGSTVLHCPYCHGWEVRDRRLGVLTTSPLSLHQAELIRQWSDRVVVFTAGLGQITPEAERRLRSRGIVLEPEPVTRILGEGTSVARRGERRPRRRGLRRRITGPGVGDAPAFPAGSTGLPRPTRTCGGTRACPPPCRGCVPPRGRP